MRQFLWFSNTVYRSSSEVILNFEREREKKIDKNANFSIIWAADDASKFRCSLEEDKSWNCSLNVGRGWNWNVAVGSILEDLQTVGQSD